MNPLVLSSSALSMPPPELLLTFRRRVILSIRRPKVRIIFSSLTLLVVLSFCVQACAAEPPVATKNKITLITGGYGYEVGDIVRIDPQKQPELGDIVQYDWFLNKNSCGAMGPPLYLVKIIGLPGDTVSFQQWSYEANGYEVTLERYYEANDRTYQHRPQTIQVLWAPEKLDNVAGMNLKVPTGEYLADKWIGYACVPGGYNLFTVKSEAITGVLIEKIGHDKEFEEEQKNTVY